MVTVMFCFLLPARLQWLEPAGGKQSTDVEQKTYALIYPDLSTWMFGKKKGLFSTILILGFILLTFVHAK